MAEKKKLTKKARRKAVEAWRERGKASGEANALVDAGLSAPSRAEAQKASGQVSDAEEE